MEQYCISLEQAKRLKELGFDRESRCLWYEVESRDKGILPFFNGLPSWLDHRPVKEYPAYHVGELGDFLPSHIVTDEGVYFLNTVKYEGIGWAMIYQSGDNSYLTRSDEETEAQARGTLLIYLLEMKLI